MPNRVILDGQVFGRLTVMETIFGSRNSKSRCRCECGSEVTVTSYNLKSGNTLSCGCLSTESRSALGRATGPIQGKKNATHGMSGTRTYTSWRDAINRCHLPSSTRYPEYGARGIAVCERWRSSFENFLADMGPCPPGMTIERKENAIGYEPGNCEWATREAQSQNRSWNKANPTIVHDIRARHASGESTAALAKEYGMCWSSAKNIVNRVTWKNV